MLFWKTDDSILAKPGAATTCCPDLFLSFYEIYQAEIIDFAGGLFDQLWPTAAATFLTFLPLVTLGFNRTLKWAF